MESYSDKKNELLILLPPRDCITPHYMCYKQSQIIHNATYKMEHWMEVSNYVCFVAFPVILLFCIVGNVVNITVFAKQFRTSMDTYLLGMSTASVFQAISTIVLCLVHYVGYHEYLVWTQKYALIARDWFWFSHVWLLILMSLERSITVTSNKSQSLCNSTQAAIVVVLVYLIGFVSALPRFWEYEVEEVGSLKLGKSFLMLQKSTQNEIQEYKAIYYWYITSITVFLPTPLLFFMLFPLCYGTRQTVISRNYLFIKHSASTALILNRRLKEEIALTKLGIVMVVLYLILMGPYLFLDLISHFMPEWTGEGTPLYITIQNIFIICFHSNFMWYQQIYFCCNKQYRLTFLSKCCCCC